MATAFAPQPDSLKPPKGLVGSNLLNVLVQMTPARNLLAVQRTFEPFSLQTPADNPYGVLFAFSTASAGVRKVRTDRTGPKISSRAIRCVWETPVNIVWAYQYPFDGKSHGALQRSAPSASPVFVSSVMRANCSALLIAPKSVFLSSGLPTRINAIRRFSFSITSSWTFSCTSKRDPAQQT